MEGKDVDTEARFEWMTCCAERVGQVAASCLEQDPSPGVGQAAKG